MPLDKCTELFNYLCPSRKQHWGLEALKRGGGNACVYMCQIEKARRKRAMGAVFGGSLGL